MPSNRQRRQAAQRHLQRQLERRAELAQRRRRNLLIVVTVLAVLVVAGAAWLLTGIGSDDDSSAATDSPAPSSAPNAPIGDDGTDGTCDFTPGNEANPDLVDVGVPPAEVATSGTLTLAMTTNVGPIGLTLDQAAAPCATASFRYLTGEGFFDGTPCHRQTDSDGLKVLQCGDPSGTGRGGPSYVYPTKVTGTETYTRGTVAMANGGRGTDSSQFFLVYADSVLPPGYTVVGTIDAAGLATLDTIATAGNDGSTSPGDGAPTQPVTIESMTIVS